MLTLTFPEELHNIDMVRHEITYHIKRFWHDLYIHKISDHVITFTKKNITIEFIVFQFTSYF